ncbi:high mobility group B protein 7 [Diachasma alloeum]|uniref:high mobility group B protein 7 n=1 Tax=Diachasma alloeum TaxID=454923 RepID=UPI0007382D7B|nr:high mobility group B protein 7 [Diachasma alloeum]
MESADQEPLDDDTQETTERKSPRSRSNSSSSDNSMNPSPSVSNSFLSNSTVTVNKTNWKSPNAFLNYVQDFRQNLRETNEVVQPSNVIRLAGQQWRALPDDERKLYVDGALAIKRTKSKNISERKKSRKRARARSKVRERKSSSSPRKNFKKKAKRKN